MTNEEAKNWIQRLIETMKEETRGEWADSEYKDEVYEALEMAIEALEQEPCDDCVSRQAVMNLIDKGYVDKVPYERKEGNTVYRGYDTYHSINYSKLKELPLVKPKLAKNERITTIPMPFEYS